MKAWRELERALQGGPAVLVSVHEVQGSGPREVGAWMAITCAGGLIGTIGGGQLEFDAIARAHELLDRAAPCDEVTRYALGPTLGQCCGGVVHLRFEWLEEGAGGIRERLAGVEARVSVVLFGGGHVGRAIVTLLGRLPADVFWVDSREEIFPPALPDNVNAEHSEPVQAAVRDVAPGSRVLIMSFSHAEDLDIVAACLLRQRERRDLPFIGLIGSKSKWAAFRHRLEARGFTEQEISHITCPIGVPGITGKEPEVIAIAVVAQLLAG